MIGKFEKPQVRWLPFLTLTPTLSPKSRKKENDAINKLTNEGSKVSCHYFIKKNGEILTLVPDLYISWHAGISSWKKFKSLNKYSIGIEISNKGHDYEYKNFNKKQIKSIVSLSNFLIKKYKIILKTL